MSSINQRPATTAVQDGEDEHGEFHVPSCSCGWAGREWADADQADLERLAHGDTHAPAITVPTLAGAVSATVYLTTAPDSPVYLVAADQTPGLTR